MNKSVDRLSKATGGRTVDWGDRMHDMTKVCKVCGRRFHWQKRWEKNWDSIKICSQKCRRQGLDRMDQEIEKTILALLEKRSGGGQGKTICPFEVAQLLFGKNAHEEMERVRQAARRLAFRGEVAVYQKGKIVDPFSFRGPIRVGYPAKST